jgi:hypothetical protein
MKLSHSTGRLSGVFSAQTGVLVDITNSSSSYPSDRPDAAGSPAYAIRAPGLENLDFSLSKTVSLTERFRGHIQHS